jgi:hypothetical protein
LQSTSSNGSSPGGSSSGSLLGLEELLLGVGSLGAVVGITKDGSKDSEADNVVEDSAEGNSRWLDGWEVYRISIEIKLSCRGENGDGVT